MFVITYIGRDCLLLFFMKYIVYIFLNMTRFVGSLGYICLPSFMSFSAVVSEICILNQNNNNLEIYSFQFNSSPGHIIYCVILQFKPDLLYGHMFTLTKLELRKLQIKRKLWPSLYTQYFRTV